MKTAVRLAAEQIAPLSDQDVADIAASFQTATADIVAARSTAALARLKATIPGEPTLVVAGGVAANQQIGAALRKAATDAGAKLVIPPPALCTDNGAMIAWAGAERLALGDTDTLDVTARPRWPLDDTDMALHAA